MNSKVCALPTWVIICEFPSPFARIRKLPWWSPSSPCGGGERMGCSRGGLDQWRVHLAGKSSVSGRVERCGWMLHHERLTWNLKITQLKRKIIFQTIIFRFHVNLPGCMLDQEDFCLWLEAIMAGEMLGATKKTAGNLVKHVRWWVWCKIVHHLATNSICFVDPGGPSWLPFWIELPDVYFHLSICWCIIGSHSSISTGVVFQNHKLSISQSPNKNSESFPRWRCALCDLLFVLLEILGWKIQPCYIITGGNLPTSTGERQVSEPSRVQLRMGASVMEFNVLAEEVIRSKVSDLAGTWFLMGRTMSRYLEETH